MSKGKKIFVVLLILLISFVYIYYASSKNYNYYRCHEAFTSDELNGAESYKFTPSDTPSLERCREEYKTKPLPLPKFLQIPSVGGYI